MSTGHTVELAAQELVTIRVVLRAHIRESERWAAATPDPEIAAFWHDNITHARAALRALEQTRYVA